MLNAPRDLVWEAWTKPRHIMNWWGPEGFTNNIDKMEVKPGGTWKFVMHGPDGRNYKNLSRYKEVIKPGKIVFDHISAPNFTATINFEELGDKTALTLRMLFESSELL